MGVAVVVSTRPDGVLRLAHRIMPPCEKLEREVNDDTDHKQTLKVRLLAPHDVRDLRSGQLLKRAADNTVAVKLGPGDGTLLEEVP
ncbi:MAG: hypothetical protein MUE50_25215, partial [Pirellulaceae bacterium]|jgi:hypothetical protein|nr:hypothetical protein [Pirellulaceae bacterium]